MRLMNRKGEHMNHAMILCLSYLSKRNHPNLPKLETQPSKSHKVREFLLYKRVQIQGKVTEQVK